MHTQPFLHIEDDPKFKNFKILNFKILKFRSGLPGVVAGLHGPADDFDDQALELRLQFLRRRGGPQESGEAAGGGLDGWK